MKFVFSKSRSQDFQKNFNLILTEQRAQRVDLARIHKLISEYINRVDLNPRLPDDEEEQPDDISDSNIGE